MQKRGTSSRETILAKAVGKIDNVKPQDKTQKFLDVLNLLAIQSMRYYIASI